jgi:hypothetical protein
MIPTKCHVGVVGIFGRESEMPKRVLPDILNDIEFFFQFSADL